MAYKKLIALALIAAGTYAENQPAFTEGQKFEASDDIADKMLADKVASVDEAAAEQKSTGKSTKTVKVRLLTDSALGNCNDLLDLDPAAAKEAEAAGIADSSKGAVAYAATLDQNKV